MDGEFRKLFLCFSEGFAREEYVSATDVKFARKTKCVKEDIGGLAVQDLWYTIVQTDQIPQRVGIDMCHAPNSPCPGNFLEHTFL